MSPFHHTATHVSQYTTKRDGEWLEVFGKSFWFYQNYLNHRQLLLPMQFYSKTHTMWDLESWFVVISSFANLFNINIVSNFKIFACNLLTLVLLCRYFGITLDYLVSARKCIFNVTNLRKSSLSPRKSYLWNTEYAFALGLLVEFVKCFDLSQNQSMREHTSTNQ